MSNKAKNKSIIKTIWKFMNKSPILSAIIISIAAILGSQGYKLYTYIYWLPYFNLFEVPTYYFEDTVFDKYELLLELSPKFIFITLVFILFNYLEMKSKLETKLGFIKSLILYLVGITILITLFYILPTKTSLPIFWTSTLPTNICIAIILLLFKKIILHMFANKMIKPTISLLAIFTSLFFIISCGMVYINGYNINVLNSMYNESRIIENNKFIVFETSEHFYVIACDEKDDNSVKVYRDSYAFIEKENQNVIKKQYNNIYNEDDLSLSDAQTNFTTVYW
ncbi:MAG: hypothetical protein U0M02_09720 [Acutalibacteraceae bacterium]|nr:hypothetical protein [Acutalibacteraceae bacterium]